MKTGIMKGMRVIAGAIFLLLGLSHFYYTREMAIFVPLPVGAPVFVYVVGTVFVTASFLILFNQWVRQAFIAIGCTLALSGGFVQIGVEWFSQDEILKNVGLANITKLLVACFIFLIMVLGTQKRSG